MPHCTDQNAGGAPGGTDSVPRAKVGAVLAAMGGHFATRRPDGLLAPDDLTVCIGAAVYQVTGRSAFGGSAALIKAVVNALPESEPACTRGQYAAVLLKEAAAYGGEEAAR